MSIGDKLSAYKYALNSTIGTSDFKPLDKMIKDNMSRITNGLKEENKNKGTKKGIK